MGPHKLTMSMKSKRLFAHKKKKENTVLVTVVSLLLESSGQSRKRKRKKNTFFFWLLPQKKRKPGRTCTGEKKYTEGSQECLGRTTRKKKKERENMR